ncbi:diablo homolog, mitochondrial-like [Bombus flavifrons]|uniref:diablo homolog, mitochondrial-like n=1 Tax=Bombus flavifrons TaxID=103934 RepID=UPI00370445BA
MLLRQLLRVLLKRASPVMYATSFTFVNQPETNKPTENDKLQFEPVDVKKLTPEYMIQQSTIDAVNSATQSLTVTYTAIMKTSKEYKELLCELITLSRETLEFNVSDSHWDMIVELRSQVQSKKEILTKLTGYVEYVHKMAVAASELSYLSGLDNLSFTLTQRIDDALRIIKEEVNYIMILEQEYCGVQKECIKNSSKINNESADKEKPNEFI